MRAGRLGPCPDSCAYRGGCSYPSICRVEAREVHRPSSARRSSGATARCWCSAGAGTGKTSVLVERFVRAVLRRRRGRGRDPRDHVHREGGRRAQAARPRRASWSSAARRRRARPRRPGSPRSTASARGCCAPTRSRRASTPSSGCSTRVEAERLALDAFDRALAEFLERGRERRAAAPDRRLQRRDRLADMVRTAYGSCAAGASEPDAARDRPARAPAGEREALAAAAAARRWPSWRRARAARRWRGAWTKVERCAALLDRLEHDALAEHGGARRAWPSSRRRRRRSRAPPARRTSTRTPPTPSLLPAPRASTSTTCCCAS